MKSWHVRVIAVGIVAFAFMFGGCGGDDPEDHSSEVTVTMTVGEYRTFIFAGSYTGDINWLTDDKNVAAVNPEGNGGDGTEATVYAVSAGETDLIAIDERLDGTGWHIVVK